MPVRTLEEKEAGLLRVRRTRGEDAVGSPGGNRLSSPNALTQLADNIKWVTVTRSKPFKDVIWIAAGGLR